MITIYYITINIIKIGRGRKKIKRNVKRSAKMGETKKNHIISTHIKIHDEII